MSNGIDQVVIGHQFSLADPIDFASVGNGEAMFMESGGEEQSSKSNEANDWSAVNETSTEVTGELITDIYFISNWQERWPNCLIIVSNVLEYLY
jgi:hypothetical protein